jgi:adenylate kinase family enzyme
MKRSTLDPGTLNTLPRRIHITGGPGSGKSHLARRLGSLLDAPVFDLDGLALGIQPSYTDEHGIVDHEGLIAARERELAALAEHETWVGDGSFVGYEMPLFGAADLVVWMDAPRRVACYRIVARHVKAELRRNNRWPGWHKLYLFWRWSLRYYADTNPWGLNVWGTPATRGYTAEVLHGYESKLVVCRSKADVRRLLARLDAAKIGA